MGSWTAHAVGFLRREDGVLASHDEVIATGTQADGNAATEQLEGEDVAVLSELVSELLRT